jgi:sulfopyruvate decarboxylase alpha subunit
MPAICPGEAEKSPLWKMESGARVEMSDRDPKPWQDQLFETLKGADIRQVGYVPDAGHSRLIARCKADPDIRDVVLTTEEEGVAMAAGAWLGGQRSALLMQSSGVGNCVNMLSLIRACRFPMLMLVTMRGEWEEFNPWQVPMGSIVEPTLKLCDTHVAKVEQPSEVVPAVQNALQLAFGDDRAAAVLLSQKLIGRKVWVK